MVQAFTHQVLAHQVKIDSGVGATQHIEPNDTPKAGEPSTVWFALTRRGGESIPLDACACELEVYRLPIEPHTAPIQQPPLFPLSAEGYEAIPATEVTFPTVGRYQLVLTGQPQSSQSFDPFELKFEVTVAQGVAQADAQENDAQENDAQENDAQENESSDETGVAASDLGESDIASPNDSNLDSNLIGQTLDSTESTIDSEITPPEPVTLPPEDATLPLGIGVGVVILVTGIAWRLRPRRSPSHPQSQPNED